MAQTEGHYGFAGIGAIFVLAVLPHAYASARLAGVLPGGYDNTQ